MTGCVAYRCLDTASIVLADMQLTNINTEELIRETLGSDTCDARRSVSDPPGGGKPDTGPCAFDRGLKSKYPAYDFPGRRSDSLWQRNHCKELFRTVVQVWGLLKGPSSSL